MSVRRIDKGGALPALIALFGAGCFTPSMRVVESDAGTGAPDAAADTGGGGSDAGGVRGTGGSGAGGAAIGTGGVVGTGGAGPGVGGATGAGGASHGTGGSPAPGSGGASMGVGGMRAGTGGAATGTGGVAGTGERAGTGGAMGTGGAVGTGGAMGTGGAAVGTGGRAGTGGAMGTGGAAVDACAGACGPRTFCNQARAVCLTTDPEWVPVAGGTFTMGNDAAPSPYSDFSPWGPAHQVHVPDFQMLRTEVTVAQYRACVNAGTCTLPMNPYGDSRDAYSHAGFDNHPVNNVTSSQAAAYCAFVGGRLPSEAEWEYADSNGGMGIYAWNYGGDHSGFDCNHAVIGSNGCGMNSTWEVCSKPLGNTSHGLCDMTGNVSEWTADDYSLYDANKDGIIDTPVDGSAYHSPNHTDFTSVFRVGSYIDTLAIGKIIITDLQSCFYRATLSSYPYGYNVGFRCARDATR